MSLVDREKKAVSAPAIIADISNNTSIAMISMVTLDGVDAPADICNNKDVIFVSPSVLSKCFSLVSVSKLKKGTETVAPLI